MTLKDILHVALICALLQITNFNCASAQTRQQIIKDPIVYYTTTELACSEGYPAQEHKVITDDGYVLTLHRIPGGRTRAKIPRRNTHYHKVHLHHHPDFNDCIRESRNVTGTGIPVVFVHALLMASDGWLLQGPGKDLAYKMADLGYDIWLANVRGNYFSREHLTLTPDDPKFWDFSFHEHGVSDLPAVIDHILQVTKKDKVGYVGLSMGSTTFFIMTSMRPEYNDKILGFAGLAPVAYIKEKHMKPGRKAVFNLFRAVVNRFAERGDIHEVFPRSENIVGLAKNVCSKGSLEDFCYDFISVFIGSHSKLVPRTIFHLYVTHAPTGSSLKTILHYLKNVKSNTFSQYDYGSEKNMEVYGSPAPPDYPLGKITAPVALYYSDDDFFYDVKDIEELKAILPNLMDEDKRHSYNHIDFLWSYTVKDEVYPKALSFFQKLSDQYYLQRSKKSIETY